ncbi:hypothetical protein C8J57DRAFT_1459098, partial [Mycena rebaudengoi]
MSQIGAGEKISIHTTSWRQRMGRKRRSQLEAAARARGGRHLTVSVVYDSDDPRYKEETRWTGGVNHCLSDSSNQWETDAETAAPLGLENTLGDSRGDLEPQASDSDSDLELLELDDAAVVGFFAQKAAREAELWRLSGIKMDLDTKEWGKVEAKRNLGYNGHGKSTMYAQAKKARDRKAASALAKETPQAKSFAGFFQPRARTVPQPHIQSSATDADAGPAFPPRPPTPEPPGDAAPYSLPPYLPHLSAVNYIPLQT